MGDQPDTYAEPEFSSQVSEARYFHLHCRRITDPRMVVICGGRETCACDYEIDRATFPYFGIEWVERGRGEIWLDGRRYPLQPSSVFCYGPGIRYTMRTDPRNLMTKCFVDFAGTEARDLLIRASAPPGRSLQVFHVLELSEVFEGLYREGMRQGHDSQEIGAVYLRLLLLKIKALQVPFQAGSPVRLKTFQRCRQFIQDHFQRYTSIEDLAPALKLTPSYLCRLFREHGEVSPYQFLIRTRMNYALDRLILSGGSVKQACYEAGFTDPDHFSRLFKKVHGLPPSELALKIRATTERTRAQDVARVPGDPS
jgi:AraC-like DNA-binding protein